MGAILTFDCGCLLALDAYPEGYENDIKMKYHIDTASWCSKHKDEVKRGLMDHLTRETEQVTKFIDNWYHDRKVTHTQNHLLGYDKVKTQPKTDDNPYTVVAEDEA